MRVLTRWDDRLTTEETNEFLTELALWHIAQVPEGTARRDVTAGIASSDYSLLCNLDLDYGQLSPSGAIHLRQALAFFQKRVDLDIGVDRKAVAFRKFLAAEKACAETNRLFSTWSRGRVCFPRDVESVLFRAQRKISSILGDLPSVSDLKLRFGPGATTQVKKRIASARVKLGERFACSEEFLSGLCDSLEELPLWVDSKTPTSADLDIEVHDGKIEFVPKNAKTDRGIAVEPMLNSMFQLGIGDYISRRLLHSGVDLQDQTKNQRLALVGSLTGELATLDLSSASDTISRELVFHLLPIDWALLLDSYRTGTMRYEGFRIHLQKFSSMGNGFTFPLESLIFYSLAFASCEAVLGRSPHCDEISVYGDDIIVPSKVYSFLTRILTFCGFEVNTEKSFSSGPFRESCGKDYLSGIDIRPCYIKDALDGPSLFVLHNFYVRNFQDWPALRIRSLLAPHLQIFGPDGYGDGHLLGDWVPKFLGSRKPKPFPKDGNVPSDWRSPRYTAGYGGYTFDTFTLKARKSFRPTPGDCILPAYTIYATPPQAGVADVPDSVWRRLRVGRLYADYREPYYRSSVGPCSYTKGRLGVTIPGSKGYKRISIYTLST